MLRVSVSGVQAATWATKGREGGVRGRGVRGGRALPPPVHNEMLLQVLRVLILSQYSARKVSAAMERRYG